MNHISPQPGQIPQENGFSTDKSINLSYRNFRTGLRTSNYADLTCVRAPSIETGASCKLSACKIDQVRSNSYLEARDSSFQTVQSASSAKLRDCTATTIDSDSYTEIDQTSADQVISSSSCKISNCPNVAKVVSHSYLEAFGSRLGDATSSSSMKITQCDVASARSGSYFEGRESRIGTIYSSSSAKLFKMQGVQSVTAGSYLEVTDSTIQDVTAARSVRLQGTSVNGALKASSLEAHGGKVVSVTLEGKATLANCDVIEKIFASRIDGTNCKILGELNATSEILIKDSDEVRSVKSKKAFVIDTTVVGDINAINLKLANSVVKGTVTTANQELVLKNSYISKLVMQKPEAFAELSTAHIHDLFQQRSVPQDIRTLVEYILLDKAKIELIGNQYKITIGDSLITVNADSRGAGNQFQNVIGNMCVSAGSVTIGGISINGVNIGGISMSGGRISGGKITTRDGEEYPMEILNDPRKILQARDTVNQMKVDLENERRRLAETAPQPQVVVICGGHVEEIYFETKGGVVLCEKGGTVGKITNSQSEELMTNNVQEGFYLQEKTCEEPPQEFISPVSLDVMEDPYRTPAGHVFDKKEINSIIIQNKGVFLCPLTRSKYQEAALRRDDTLREKIEKWLKSHIPI